jgi:hypothetical protein
MLARGGTVYRLLIGAALLLMPAGVMAQPGTTLEYPYLYKSIRAMGMGGAYTAIGGRVDALFYNPAGLINIPQDKGWEVNLLNISVEYGDKTKDFIDDARNALDTPDKNGNGSSDDDQLMALNEVLAKYSGTNLHVLAADLTSIGRSYDRWAFGVGGLARARVDAIPHEGFGSTGLLEMNADATYGGVAGASIGVTTNLFAGVSVKALHRESLIHVFTSRELVDNQDNLQSYMKDLAKNGNAVGFDAGILWKFAPDSAFRPSFGASVMNIGALDFKDAGKIPQSVNVGLAINPPLSWARSLIVGVDYIDALNNFEQDTDVAKRLRYGAELQLFDRQAVELALRAGMYQSSPTLGFDLRLYILTVSYAMYTEELGAYAGQDKNKRQFLTLNLGW